MTYMHYNHVRAREPSTYYDDSDEPFYSKPLVRRFSKRQRANTFDDDEYDDYPQSSPAKPTKPSRALTIRRPSQLEKYNVFNNNNNADEHEPEYREYHRSNNTHKSHVTRLSETDDDRDEREFRLKIRATFGRPKSSHSEKPMSWPTSMFKRKDKWERVDWESREGRERRNDRFWCDEQDTRDFRYSSLKRTRTNEWKPLSGFRRL